MPQVIYLATNNKDKFRDFKLVFDRLGIVLRQIPLKVQEGSQDLLENAKLKALVTAKRYPNKIVMASDGGVIIPYLGSKWNHVLTKRLGGLDIDEKLTDRQRCQKLLKLMADAKGEDRKVVWHEAVAIVKNGQVLWARLIPGSQGYLLDHIPSDFKETGYWLGYLWYVPEAKARYMSLPPAERLKYSRWKQRFYQLLKNKTYLFSS